MRTMVIEVTLSLACSSVSVRHNMRGILTR